MKPLLWILFTLLSLLWTGSAWLLARLSDWVAQLVAAGGTVDWVAESPPLLLAGGARLLLGRLTTSLPPSSAPPPAH